MSSTRYYHASLAGRLCVSAAVVGVVSVFVALTAVVVSGLVAFVGLLVAAYVVDATVMAVLAGEVRLVWVLLDHAVWVVVLAGLLLLPRTYLGPARASIRSFRDDLRSRGTLAEERDPAVADVAARLAQQASVPAPEVRIANRRRPESYAVSGKDGGTVVLTRGLIRPLDDGQIEAVLAHEVSHLANGDSRAMDLALTPIGIAESVSHDDAPSVFSYWTVSAPPFSILRWVWWGGLRLVTTVQYVGCRFGLSVFSRGREFAADRAAAQLTGDPAALASALETLDDERGAPDADARTLSESAGALDILPQRETSVGVLHTHPSTAVRVDRLSSMTADERS